VLPPRNAQSMRKKTMYGGLRRLLSRPKEIFLKVIPRAWNEATSRPQMEQPPAESRYDGRF